ncbi:MAG: glycosyltransferase family 9 protein [Pseudomonadota bacterium]|nr:glycosyltransferase family 9 protein [Pseudomonadota bacterium]
MKILVIQNRMGIGDMVMFLPFVKAISNYYGEQISLMVKKNTKASEYLSGEKYIKEIIYLERSEVENRHAGIKGFFNLIKDIKDKKFDKVFIFNSSLRFYMAAKIGGIKDINCYKLLKKKNQHIIETAKKFIRDTLKVDVRENPYINLNPDSVAQAKKNYSINSDEINIVLGTGGSGETKRIPSKIFIEVMKNTLKKGKCKFFIATGNTKEEIEILDQITKSDLKEFCVPLNNLNISKIIPIIKNCNVSICNDSSFSHLSAALNIPTIVLMADTPLVYGSYSSLMHPILPEGENTVSHDTLGKNKISPSEIQKKLDEILSNVS